MKLNGQYQVVEDGEPKRFFVFTPDSKDPEPKLGDVISVEGDNASYINDGCETIIGGPQGAFLRWAIQVKRVEIAPEPKQG